MLSKMHQQKAFTLLELLIAISIFSVLSVMAYGGLKTVLDNRAGNKIIADRVAASQIAMLRLSNDLRQAVNRSVRDGFGTVIPAMLSQDLGNSALEWTRAGYSNPANLKRSNLQRVAYKIEDNNLIRLTWRSLDRVQDSEVSETVMLSDIESIEWRFNDLTNNWSNNWPSATAVATNTTLTLPRAVEVTIKFLDLGEIRRLFLLPVG